MLKLKFHSPGTAPATLVLPPDTSKPVVRLIQYDAQQFEDRVITDYSELWNCVAEGKVTWINIDGLGDLELFKQLGTHFGLHPLALEDVLNTAHRPKIEEYIGHSFIVTHMISCEENGDVNFEQISMFLKRNVLITIQEESSHDVFDAVRQRLRAGSGFGRIRGHDYLTYALLDAITDNYFPVLERIGEWMEDMEEELLERASKEVAQRLHVVKRILLKLRRSAWPSRELLNALMRDESGLVTADSKVFLRDCYDHTVQIIDVIESYRDLASGMLDMYLSSLSNRTNEIMRVLTVISSIFIPLTFLAGIYGMNFENMPELKTQDGYFVLLAVMILVAIGMIAFFRRKRWL